MPGNPRESLVRAIDDYLKAGAHTSDTRKVSETLRSVRADVLSAPNPVARRADPQHQILDEAKSKAQSSAPPVEVHVQIGHDAPIKQAVKERVKRG